MIILASTVIVAIRVGLKGRLKGGTPNNPTPQYDQGRLTGVFSDKTITPSESPGDDNWIPYMTSFGPPQSLKR